MEFRKEVKHINASNTPLPTCIDGISGADNIAQMWRDHYYDIVNSVNQTTLAQVMIYKKNYLVNTNFH